MTGVLTCPRCGYKQEGEIPEEQCLPFYKCLGCGEIIAADQGCCIFCDYGDRPCPVSHETQESKLHP
ncbi:MAG: GDCCVxC domain-containing (seleno)protein [Chloroflexota bacterium]